MPINRLKAWLAILAWFTFIIFVYLAFFRDMPKEAREVIMYLMGCATMLIKDVYGYYFGSSEGSARKTELLSPTDPAGQTSPASPTGQTSPASPTDQTSQTATAEAGFVHFSLLWRVSVGFALFLALAACATTQETPMQTAGKSLLAVKSTIVTAATTVDSLCRAKTISGDQCMQAAIAYNQAKTAYDSAVDSYLLMGSGGDANQFANSLAVVTRLSQTFLDLTGGAK